MNLKQILLSIIFLISLNQSKAQVDTLSVNANHKIIFSVSAGVTVPVGEFAHFKNTIYSPTENLAGAAGVGFNGKFDVKYLFFKKFGITCTLYSSVNKAIKPDSSELFFPYYSTAMGGGSRRSSFNYTTKKWYTNGLLIGPIMVVSKDKIELNYRIAGGIQLIQSPESRLDETGYIWQTNWTSVHPTSSTTIQPQMLGYNFVFDIGVDFKFQLKKKFNIFFSMDYLISQASFNGQLSYTFDENDGTNQTHTEGTKPIGFSKNISQFYFNGGVSYAIK